MKVLLVHRGVNRDKTDSYVRTPLPRAGYSGHEEVVKILLGWQEVDTDKEYGSTGKAPLSQAAWKRDEGWYEYCTVLEYEATTYNFCIFRLFVVLR